MFVYDKDYICSLAVPKEQKNSFLAIVQQSPGVARKSQLWKVLQVSSVYPRFYKISTPKHLA